MPPKKGETKEEYKIRKSAYDKEYRLKNFDTVKVRKQAQAKTSLGRAAQKRNREKFKNSHLAYCRTPEYREWKKEYDQNHRAKKFFGEFYESAILLERIADIVDNREANQLKGTFNKSQKRKRSWLKNQKTNLPPLP